MNNNDRVARLAELAGTAPGLPGPTVAAQFNTFLTQGLGLVVNRRRGYVTRLFRRVQVMSRIRNTLEFFGDGGDALLYRLENFFDGQGPATLLFPNDQYNSIAVMAAIVLTAHAPNPALNYRFFFEVTAITGEGNTIRIWRPINQFFARYATNAIWAFLQGGVVSGASDYDIEERYDIDEYEFLQGATNVMIRVSRITSNVGEASVGAFWRYYLDERWPESLADDAQVYKLSENKHIQADMEKGVEWSRGEFAEADCLGYTLFRAGVDVEVLKRYYQLNAMNTTSFFPSNKIGLLHTVLGLNIAVRRYSSDKRRRNENVCYYPKKLKEGDKPYIPIGRLLGHYFLDIETGWTNAGSKNFLLNYDFLGEDKARTFPPSFFYDKNSRATVNGERVLGYVNRGGVNAGKKITMGELLCNLSFGTSRPTQPIFMKPMKLDDYMMKTECFLHFKENFRNQNLVLTEEEFSSLWSQGGMKLDSQPSLMASCEYPAIELELKKKVNATLEKGSDWIVKDRFGIKASMMMRKDGRESRVPYFIPLKYTFVAFDIEAYSRDSDRAFVPYLASICYYDKNGRAFDFREWSDPEPCSTPYQFEAMIARKSFRGKNCCDDLLDFLANSPIFSDVFLCLAAHNLNFDLSMLIRNTNKIRMMEGVFKSISKTNCCDALLCPTTSEGGFVRGRRVYFLDTLPITTIPLRKFANAFELDNVKKEIMPFGLYTQSNVKKFFDDGDCMVPIKDITLDEGQKMDEFIKAARWGRALFQGETVLDAARYAEFYCEQDCHTLLAGIMKHRVNCYNVPLINNWEPCRLDILNCISIPQYASHYLGLNGCFEGAYEISGVLRDYIARSVVGGRCMVEANIPHVYGAGGFAPSKEEEEVEDFDACSLYPTAEARGCDEAYGHQGYPIGKPKRWNSSIDLTSPKIAQYFITVKITEVGKFLRFPLFPSVKKNGGRHWSNDVVGQEFVFDKVQWEDAQKFQEAKGEIICGVYFDEGGNKGMGNCMNFLYQERLRRKQHENARAMREGRPKADFRSQSNLCKTIMNSSYGRLIMKPIEDSTQFCYGEEDFLKLCFKHHHTISEIAEVRGKNDEGVSDSDTFYVVKKKELVRQKEHYSLPHWGAFVLSESKRVMNEVMCTAEDVGVRIHYQDTDSMHLVKAHLPKLAEALKERYGDRPLGSLISGEPGYDGKEWKTKVPEALGRFHGDFAPLVNDENLAYQYEAPVSLFCAFVGKKMYYDDLLQRHKTDPSKNKTGSHAKMKGISGKSLDLYAKEYYGSSEKPIKDLYLDLMRMGKHSFDLVKGGVKFKPCMDGTIINLASFVRQVGMQREDAKLALEEWKKFFPDEECPNPFLEDSIRTLEDIERVERQNEEEGEDEELPLTQEIPMSPMPECGECETDEEDAGAPPKLFLIESSREEIEGQLNPPVGSPPRKRRRVFLVDEVDPGFIGGDEISPWDIESTYKE